MEDDNEYISGDRDSNGKVIQLGRAHEYGHNHNRGYIDTELKKAKAIENEEQENQRIKNY